jgi:hypothetical protein
MLNKVVDERLKQMYQVSKPSQISMFILNYEKVTFGKLALQQQYLAKFIIFKILTLTTLWGLHTVDLSYASPLTNSILFSLVFCK